MIHLHTEDEIGAIRESGLVLWGAHQAARRLVKPGTTTARINRAVESHIASHGADMLLKGVPGVVPFPAATCISVNEAVVHGIPGERRLQEGDIVGIDISVRYHGWCSDAAVTYPVGSVEPGRRRLLDVTEETLRIAVQQLGRQTLWSAVAKAMSGYVHAEGFSVVEALCGHGIGHELWEEPTVPNYWSKTLARHADFSIRPGMVFCVEPMVNMGTKEVRCRSDHWTIVTRDGRPSAHFEHTIAITDNGPAVLTTGPNGEGWAL